MKSKTKIAKNKKHTLLKDKCVYSTSLVEEEKGKCLIFFPLIPLSQKEDFCDGFLGYLQEPLGLVAILVGHKIDFNILYIRPSKKCICSNCFDCDKELVFEYDKKHTKEIKKIEKAYFGRKIRIEAVKMTQLLLNIVNMITIKRTALISLYKREFSKK
jgi:hypothetical protein